MTFESSIDGMLATAFATIGQSAIFTPAAGDAVTINVNKSREVVQQGFEATAWTTETTIEASLSDLPHEPNRGETFTIDSTVYTVREVMENDGYTVKLVVR